MNDKPTHVPEPETANELASGSSLLDARDFRNALGTFATGVTIITAVAGDGKPYGLTCNSFASVSLNPPLVGFLPDKNSTTWPRIRNAGRFCVNVLASDQIETCQRLAGTLKPLDHGRTRGLTRPPAYTARRTRHGGPWSNGEPIAASIMNGADKKTSARRGP